MDDLHQLMTDRALAVPAVVPAAPVVTPTTPTKTPPRVNRFNTAQAMQEAYRNNWQPNPLIIRALGGSK